MSLVVSSAAYGAAYGLLPIGWIVFTAILLYRLTVETGKFEIIKDSIGSLTGDQRLQALLIAFAFGAFIEGAAGFGTPVAVAAAMLTGLGFDPFYAAANLPAGEYLAGRVRVDRDSADRACRRLPDLPIAALSADVGRICAPVSLFVPAYLVLVMGGMKALRAVLPAAAVCGIAFAGTQFLRIELHGSVTDGYPGVARRDRGAGDPVEGVEAEGRGSRATSASTLPGGECFPGLDAVRVAGRVWCCCGATRA